MKVLQTFWKSQVIAVRQNGFYGSVFEGGRGVTQGDIISPTIFNIMVDSVVRVLDMEITNHEDMEVKTTQIFYADDGYISGIDGDRVQTVMDYETRLFGRIGLCMNYEKTKVMVG